jgi:hypothetical protein
MRRVIGKVGLKRHPLNMRTTAESRSRLEEAANESGRSLVQEVEHRLEKTFAMEEFLSGLFGGPHTVRLLTVLGAAIREVEAQQGSRWDADAGTLKLVRAIIDNVVCNELGSAKPGKESTSLSGSDASAEDVEVKAARKVVLRRGYGPRKIRLKGTDRP